MKVDFWLGKAAKRASQATITLASIRKANFDFVETATLVVCVNKFLHTRSLAAFNFQFAELRLPCQGKNKNRLLGRNGC